MKSVINSENMAVISTAHLTEEEAETMRDAHHLGDDIYLLYCDQVVVGLPRLNYILGFLVGRGFQWVMFRPSAPTVPEFETFDW